MTDQSTPTVDNIDFHILEQDRISAGSAYRAAVKQVHLTTARIIAGGVLDTFPAARFIEFMDSDEQYDTLRPFAILDKDREQIDSNGGHGGVEVFADDMCDMMFDYSTDLPYRKPETITVVDGEQQRGPADSDYDWFLIEDNGQRKLMDIAAVLDQYRESR